MLIPLSLLALLSTAPQDPVLLADIDSVTSGLLQDGDPEHLVEFGGDLWLAAQGDLWRYSPATGDAIELTDSWDLSAPVVPVGGGRYVQRLQDSIGNNTIVSTDGTPAGTESLLDSGSWALRSPVFEWAGGVYFFATLSGNLAELWTTDGTAAGTVLVQRVGTQVLGSFDQVDFAIAGGSLYVANETSSGIAVLSSPAATPVELGPGAGLIADFEHSIDFAGRLCFSAGIGEPWITDGTAAGTFELANLQPGTGSDPEFLASDGTRAWFSAYTLNTGRELYVTTGTPAGTQLVIDLAPGTREGIPQLAPGPAFERIAILLPGGDLLFSGSSDADFGGIQEDFELWRSDGTALGTFQVAALNPGTPGSKPSSFVEAGGIVYFAATLPQVGREVVRTDGTPQGTFLAADAFPGPNSSNPGLWSELGAVWFSGFGDQAGRELFRTDGSQAGTSLAYEFAPETTGDGIAFTSNPTSEVLFGRLDGELLFAATSDPEGRELWATDGTPGGTRLVVDLAPGDTDGSPLDFGPVLGGRAAFTAFDGVGRRLFLTDGTAAGTVGLTDPALATSPREIVRLGERLLFVTGSFQVPDALWSTDGTPAGTVQLAQIEIDGYQHAEGLLDSVELDGFLYFGAQDAQGVYSIWRSDGTAAGTQPYAAIPPGGFESPFGFMRDPDQVLCFVPSQTPGFWFDLWSIDGTPGGATPLFGVNFFPDEVVPLGAGNLVVPRNTQSDELFFTDGTLAGTVGLAEFTPGFLIGEALHFVVIGDRAYFSAPSGGVSGAWWSTDGTVAGTQPLPTAAAVQADGFSGFGALGSLRELVYGAYEPQFGTELWRHDPATGAMSRITDVFPGAESSRPSRIAEINGQLVFDADHPVFGRELFAISLAELGVPSANPSAPGCGFALPSPKLSMVGDLRPGGTFDLRLEAAPPGAISVALRSAPAPWLPLGSGCTAAVDLAGAVIFAVQATNALGVAENSLTLPNNPALAGLELSVQSVVTEPGGPLFGQLGATNGLDVTLVP